MRWHGAPADSRVPSRPWFSIIGATLPWLAATLLLPWAPAGYAATPTRIQFEGDANSGEGKKYSLYTVRCSNGQIRSLTAWDNRRDWCVSHTARVSCHTRQLAAARQACNEKE